jgi:16S rRNA (uracil1498-N3)-methyltransferase
MHRFYVAPEILTGDPVPLPAEAAHQLFRVLRLRPGARIVLFCGDGEECEAEVLTLDQRSATARLLERRRPEVELRCRLHVALAVLKGEKLDWAAQKLTELGASRISLLTTERTVVSAGEERWPRRLERLRKIAQEAAEQSGRVRLPDLREPVTLPQLLAEHPEAFILAPGAGIALSAAVSPCPDDVTVLVGPEGGFSAAEVARALDLGAGAVSLGRRILRAETAALAAATLVAAASDSLDQSDR